MKATALFLWRLLPLLIALAALGWVLFRWLKKSEEPGALVGRWIVTLILAGVLLVIGVRAEDEISKIFAVLAGALGGLVLAVLWVPSLCEFVGRQFGSLYDGGTQEIVPQPFYSIAEAKRKLGKYSEALAEIRRQLEMFPNDFAGWMMLAEIQAEEMHDLPGAEETVEQILAQEGHLPANLALILNRLADWHLKADDQAAGAQSALERIILLLPETEHAQLARHRIAHLATPQRMAEMRAPSQIVLHAGATNIGLRHDSATLRPTAQDPTVRAGEILRHLDEHPQDNDAREELALLYAGHFQRLDLATDQFEQMIATPHQVSKHVVRWINLLADVQVRLGSDAAQVRETLQRIPDLYPKTAAAETALHRIAYLKLEFRTKEKSQVVKLGSYEQNLGLKEGKA